MSALGGLHVTNRGGLDHPATARLAPCGDLYRAPTPEEDDDRERLLDSAGEVFGRLLRWLLGRNLGGFRVRAALLRERLYPTGISDNRLALRLGVTRQDLSKHSRRLARAVPELARARGRGARRSA